MNITVNVDEVTLETVVGRVGCYDTDEDRAAIGDGQECTIADLVAARIVHRIASGESWAPLSRRVTEIRDEVIREKVRPVIEEALTTEHQRTDEWGEPAGKPRTLRQMIMDATHRLLSEPADNYHREQGTIVQKIVRDEVKAALTKEIRDAVQQARAQVADEIGEQVADTVKTALKR